MYARARTEGYRVWVCVYALGARPLATGNGLRAWRMYVFEFEFEYFRFPFPVSEALCSFFFSFAFGHMS